MNLVERSTRPLPLLTASVPGTGGRLRVEPEDFVVDEIPAYDPAGEGEHLFLRIEKRSRATDDVRRELSKLLKIRQDDIGVAGLKDKHAVTRQWISVPASVLGEERAASLELAGVRVLEARRHRNKLRTGHLRGNRFEIRIRQAGPEALLRARECAGRIAKEGVPNYYGEQRFGHDGETVALGLTLLRGRAEQEGQPPRRVDRSLRRLALSSVQSALFNQLLVSRMESGRLHEVELGDVMQVVASGGSFVAEDLGREQARFDRHEIVTTGPMFGPKMLRAAGGPGEREEAILAESGLEMEAFAKQGKLLLGTRRPYLVRLEGLEVEGEGEDVWVRFTLPSGAYATVVMREIMKAD
jgi:tRNA pseudouridine13 synthase